MMLITYILVCRLMLVLMRKWKPALINETVIGITFIFEDNRKEVFEHPVTIEQLIIRGFLS